MQPHRYTVTDAGYETPCWLWNGHRNHHGYGRMLAGLAHRISYEESVGPIPDGLQIDHLCRNRACVNPSHMEPVTPRENTRRGKTLKLTDTMVSEILASPESCRSLARRFSVSDVRIGQIRRAAARSICNG